jgi:pyrroloquinoline quinone biosynthesis protein D
MSGDAGSGGQGAVKRQRVIVSAASRPNLARGRRLHYDEPRGRWVIQAPERVLSPDPIAVEVLKLCDGRHTVAEVAECLSARYNAPKELIEADVIAMLQDLADKGVIGCAPAPPH